ncbi:MAG: HAD family hydrolase [Lachnospiraceae bacterium]|nr:HAD family hydrolase [Lachnospiraceae bacterium]
MIKLIASDLDGTLLLNGAQTLNPVVFDQIRALKKMGILFVAASGRQYANLRRLFAPVADDIAYICENGCICFYEDKKILKTVMDRQLGQEIMRAIWDKDGAEILLSGENTSYLQPKKESYAHHMEYVVKNNVTIVDDIFAVPEEYFKISVYEETGIGSSSQYWQEMFGDRATVVTSGNEWLDMIPQNINKGVALQKMQEYLNITPEESMAFGDNYNDIEMLEQVKYNYVMENAPEDILATTKYRTRQVETVLEELITNHFEEEKA